MTRRAVFTCCADRAHANQAPRQSKGRRAGLCASAPLCAHAHDELGNTIVRGGSKKGTLTGVSRAQSMKARGPGLQKRAINKKKIIIRGFPVIET